MWARHALKMLKVIAQPTLAALLIGALVLMSGFALCDGSLNQLQKRTIAQADYLSSALIDFLGSPKVTTIWAAYGDPLASHLRPGELGMSLRQYTKNIETDIDTFKAPNGWVQRTWRYWNRVKVSDLFN